MATRKPRKAKASPFVADPKAMAKAEAAAEAVGMTVAELAAMMVDHGMTAVMPDDGLTERYTLEDLGIRLWTSVQGLAKSRRAEWFAGLSDVQKRALIVVLRDRGYHAEVIAQEFAVPVNLVVTTWAHYCDELGAQVVGIRLETIAGQLFAQAGRAQQAAMEKGDHGGFWRIAKEYVEMLQSLGIVDRAIHRVDHTMKVQFTEQKREEVRLLVELEMKKKQRLLEIKDAEATVLTDPTPLVTADYDEDEDDDVTQESL